MSPRLLIVNAYNVTPLCSWQIKTWETRKWLPRLEVLVKAFELGRFEKLVLVTFVAKYFSKMYLGISASPYMDIQDDISIQELVRVLFSSLEDQIMAPFRYFSSASPLVREAIITVRPSARGRVHPMLSRVDINPRIAEHLLGMADKFPRVSVKPATFIRAG
jgi:hypothetical protein